MKGKKVIIDVRSQTFKTIIKKKNNNKSQMTGKKGKKGKKGKNRKSNSKDKVFDGKIFGFEVPILSDILKNKTARSVIAGAGIVSIVLTGAQIANNSKVNKVLNTRGVKPLLALSAGDIPGGLFQLAKDENLINKVVKQGGMNSGNNQIMNEENFA